MGSLLGLLRATTLSAIAGAVVLAAPDLRAQGTDDATRAAARQLGYEGIGDFQAGNYAAAEDKLDRAFRALRAPSLGLWSARAFAKMGKLVAASERYIEVQRLDPGAGDVGVQKQAQADAESDNLALVPRIPSIVIQVEGALPDKVSVSVNGTLVPSSLLGVKRLVDPGTVKVDGEVGGAKASETVTLGEGETKTVTLRFDQNATPAAPAVAAVPTPPPAPAVPPTHEPGADRAAPSGGDRRTIGWIVLGAGGAGIVAGAVTGGLALSTRSSTEGCVGTNCPTSETDKVDSYNRLRTISSVAFIAGGALAAAGLVVVLTAPSSAPASTASFERTYRISPWFGVNAAGLSVWVER